MNIQILRPEKIFDVSRRETFINIKTWFKEIKSIVPKIIPLLVGNKIDLGKQRQVSYADGEALAKELGISYLEISAKTGENVDFVFILLVLQLIEEHLVAADISDRNLLSGKGIN